MHLTSCGWLQQALRDLWGKKWTGLLITFQRISTV
ncbi:hypothetical protein EDF88_0375 [Buttiauxella sp. BIGb0552]|jgi:hypothetical protein|nr:hypothetical protein EDF88_0375 [Buttiauxella sp. BIGb0552]